MLSERDNERLTRVGPGTPMGDALRRYWLPAALSSELPEADGAPVRVRLLGEDLIAFRDTTGSIGLVGAFCPHRRAPMFFGRNEDGGLRCVYHGWKFDRSGACVEMPSEPPDSLFKSKVGIDAYPVWEGGGIVWAYLGPRERQPSPPDLELVRAPATHRFVSKTLESANYLQCLEGGLDSSHTGFLHNSNGGDLTYLADFDALVPRIDVVKTDYGYYYTGIRLMDDRQWVRTYQYIMPSIQIRGTVGGRFLRGGIPRMDGHYWVPVDDEHTLVYNFMYSYDPAVPLPVERALEYEADHGRAPDDYADGFRLKASAANDYYIDRESQRRATFTGIAGVGTQDFAVQEGMGPIVDRTREHLGTTDRPIIVMRQLLLEAADAVAAGETPRGADPSASRNVRAIDVVIPNDRPWIEAVGSEMVARF